ncbi:MAG: hypothetical protein HUU10_06260 [Bacteroidetes bacterium]|nr:hypothetical protein [Bacteroidota bacterium]
MNKESIQFYIPINLMDALIEASEEVESEVACQRQPGEWTLLQDGNVIGWILFSPDASFMSIDIQPVHAGFARTTREWFLAVSDLMSQSVGSDQCKTGRCLE